MKTPEIPLFFHPTSTVYIDTDRDYLTSLTKSIDSNFLFFGDGHSALDYIDTHVQNTERYYALRPPINNIIDKIHSIYRFTEVGVAVSALRLSDFDGLSIFSQINRREIQTVILDTAMTHEQAIQGLNSQLLNFYLSKDDEEIEARMASIVNSLQNRYFFEMSHWLYGDTQRKSTIFDNHEFVSYFEQVIDETGIEEYYYVENPSGVLAIHRDGTIDRYIAQDLRAYDDYMSTLFKNPLIDRECVQKLEGQSYTPDFYDLNGALNLKKIRSWEDNLYPLTISQCEHPFVFAHIPACFSTDASYAAFRAVSSNQMQ